MILALDLGTKCGYAMPNGKGIISGTLDLSPKRFEGGGMRYLRFKRWLMDCIESHGVTEVVFEEVRAHNGTDAAHIYGGLMGTLQALCEEASIPYAGVPVGAIKRHLTGKGNANKGAMIEAVRALGYQPTDDNEADAIALLLCYQSGL